MANSLYPSFVQIAYHSVYAPHIATIPTLQWTPDSGYGLFETHAGSTIAADDMVEQLIDVLLPFYPSTVGFDSFTIFTMDTPTSPAIPRAFKTSAEVGSNGTPGNTKAVQGTWTFKTELGGISKIVLLDVGNNNSFEKVTQATVGVAGQAFIDEFTSDANGWAGRDGGQPVFFLQLAYTLNEKLRRNYYMD